MHAVVLVLLAMFTNASARSEIRMAVTVDDLPVHGPLPPAASRMSITMELLDALETAGLQNTYGFVNGSPMETEQELGKVLRSWISRGQSLGNHTFSHADLNRVGSAEFIADVKKNEAALKTASPAKRWRFFRYPFLHEGNTPVKRRDVRDFLKEAGYQIAAVTVPFQDYAWNEPYVRCLAKKDEASLAWLRESFLANAALGVEHADLLAQKLYGRPIPHVLLLHLGAFEAKAAADLFTQLKAKGVRFVSLEEALADPIYAVDPGQSFENGGFFLSQVLMSRGLRPADLGIPPLDNFPGERLGKICR